MGNDHLGRGNFLPVAAPEGGFPAPDLGADGLGIAPLENESGSPLGLQVFHREARDILISPMPNIFLPARLI